MRHGASQNIGGASFSTKGVNLKMLTELEIQEFDNELRRIQQLRSQVIGQNQKLLFNQISLELTTQFNIYLKVIEDFINFYYIVKEIYNCGDLNESFAIRNKYLDLKKELRRLSI